MPPTADINSLLARIIGQIGTAPQQKQNIAHTLLLKSQADWKIPNIAPPGKGGTGGPSVVSRIFDILSRPNYAVASYVGEIAEDVKKADEPSDLIDILRGASLGGEYQRAGLKGFAGRDKRTFADVLEEQGVENKVAKGLGGFALDVFADPTTYIGVGAVKALLKGGKRGLEALPKVEETAEVFDPTGLKTKAPINVKAAAKEVSPKVESILSSKIPGIRQPIEKTPRSVSMTPEARRALKMTGVSMRRKGRLGHFPSKRERFNIDFANFMREKRHEAGLRRSASIYGNLFRAEELIRGIARGDVEATAKAVPKPPVELRKPTDAETNVAITTARNSLRRISTPDKALNPQQQLRIYKNLLGKVTGSRDERISRAITMLREAEKYIASQGLGFKWWDGMNLKLSEVFDEVGDVNLIDDPDLLRQFEKGEVYDPLLEQSIESIRARSAMKDTRFVDLALSQATRKAGVAEQVMSPAKFENFKKHLEKETELGLKAAEVSPSSVGTTKGILRSILKDNDPHIQQIIDRNTKIFQKIVTPNSGVKWVQVGSKMDAAIERTVGSTYADVSKQMTPNNRWYDFLLERYAAHYGQKDLRPIAQDYRLSALSNAARRASVWRALAKNTTIDQRREAIKVAQGIIPASDEAIDSVATQMRTHMERHFSSSGLRDEADSVVLRAGMVMEDVNAELRKTGSGFQFTNKKVKDSQGNERDYTGGTNWMKSWEIADVQGDPIEFLTKMETSVEKLSKLYGYLDELSARFGNRYRSPDFSMPISHERLRGYWFPKEIASQIERSIKMFDDISDPKSGFIRNLDRVLSMWKRGVTIYSPSHHIRNLNGDVWLSWIAGVNNPVVYHKAAKVLRSQQNRYKGSMEAVENLTNKQALRDALTKPGSKIVRTKRGIDLTAEQVYIAAHQRGLLLTARQLEDIISDDTMPLKPFGGRVHDLAVDVSQLRDHFVRLAHFIDSVSKSKSKDLKTVFDEAAHQVRKWHPDGMDLTEFERKFMRRLFPFYSWHRKAVPLVLESIVMKPGKVIAYPKAMEALQIMMGVEAPSRSDPFPEDQLFPDWMREKGIGPIAKTGMGGLPGAIAGLSRQGVNQETGESIGGYTFLNPSNPMIDLFAQFGGTNAPQESLRAVGASLNPALRIPIELTTGEELFSGVPISYDPASYATKQLPIISNVSRATNVGVGGLTERGQREGFGNLEALINYLTAAGLLGSGPYVKQAQFEEKERIRRRREREEERRGGTY